MTRLPIGRRGFTLVELLLSLIVTAIVGGALVRMVLSQARFMDQQEAWRQARSVSRGGVNRLISDLRVVEATNGLAAAAAGGQDFTVRVPYAFGVVCLSTGTVTTVSLLPVDATMYAAPGFSGFAVRSNANGTYSYQTAGVALVAGVPGNCTGGAWPIATVGPILGSPAGQIINITHGNIPIPDPGSILFLFRRVRYEFKASAALPGRIGLWRTALDVGGGGLAEELAAPFDATARVNFYVLNNPVPQAAVPAQLSDVRGLELLLNGMSDRAPGGSAAPKTANFTTSVFFENRPD
jgi:prepilin-type N-terminal cleavage/methylation domain-containing protein